MTDTMHAQCQPCREIKKKSAQRPRAKEIHRAAQSRHSKTDKFAETVARHHKTDKWKDNRSRARKSEKGIVSNLRARERRLQLIASNPGMKSKKSLADAASRISSFSVKSSPLFVSNTSFSSIDEFRTHMESFFNDSNGFTWENYGKVWENEHRIPSDAYDHSDPDDAKRCWSMANMRPLEPLSNMEKSSKIIDEECILVPEEFRPKSWNGIIPCDAEKEAIYRSWKNRYEVLHQEQPLACM
jgi:hypothetical protein